MKALLALTLPAVVLASAMLTGAANAQALSPVPPSGTLARLQSTPAWRAAAPSPRLKLANSDVEAYALRQAGIARTSVDAKAGGFSGSLGVLCGRQADVGMSGAAAASGYDPDGKFVGGKLSLKF